MIFLLATNCMLCGERYQTTEPVTKKEIQKYESGALAQDAFPCISADNRDIVISALRTGAYLCNECVADDDT